MLRLKLTLRIYMQTLQKVLDLTTPSVVPFTRTDLPLRVQYYLRANLGVYTFQIYPFFWLEMHFVCTTRAFCEGSFFAAIRGRVAGKPDEIIDPAAFLYWIVDVWPSTLIIVVRARDPGEQRAAGRVFSQTLTCTVGTCQGQGYRRLDTAAIGSNAVLCTCHIVLLCPTGVLLW